MDDAYRNGAYQAANPTWHVEDSAWKARQVATILQRNEIRAETICEVGCGAGEILVQLQATFPDAFFYGYEVSPQAFSLCEPRANAKLRFRLKDLMTEEDADFDIILVMDVVEHVENYLGFLKTLRTRGMLKVFHIPLDLSVQSLLRRRPILRERSSVGHLHYFFKDTAIATLVDCGYEIVDYLYTGKQIELPGRALSARMLKVPRKIMFSMNADFAVRLLGGYSLLVLAR
jgi:hypothetical protein